ncbi:MAG: hypothetical protein JHC61_06590 [Burkholderiaceae bacterium]|nr:hypothetical protein [Burkholderiaceae bacterium]
MNFSVGNNATFNVAAAVASGDIQTLIQMVQSDRVKLMDAQLVDQVKAVQARNDQIAKLNNVLADLNAFNTQISGKDSGDTPKDWTTAKINQFELPANDAIQAAGITDLGFKSQPGQRTAGPGEAKTGVEGVKLTGTAVVSSVTTKGEIETAITKIKGMIDAESNNQQMDMLRLQSLNNKKNESVEILTTTQKKHSDSTSGIIRNF